MLLSIVIIKVASHKDDIISVSISITQCVIFTVVFGDNEVSMLPVFINNVLQILIYFFHKITLIDSFKEYIIILVLIRFLYVII